MERYQWSPDIEGKLSAAVFFEFLPEDEARREAIEDFFPFSIPR